MDVNLNFSSSNNNNINMGVTGNKDMCNNNIQWLFFFMHWINKMLLVTKITSFWFKINEKYLFEEETIQRNYIVLLSWHLNNSLWQSINTSVKEVLMDWLTTLSIFMLITLQKVGTSSFLLVFCLDWYVSIFANWSGMSTLLIWFASEMSLFGRKVEWQIL